MYIWCQYYLTQNFQGICYGSGLQLKPLNTPDKALQVPTPDFFSSYFLSLPSFFFLSYFWLHWVFLAGCQLSCPQACGILISWQGSLLVPPDRVRHDWSDLAAAAACIGRWLQNHWTAREVPVTSFLQTSLVLTKISDTLTGPLSLRSGSSRLLMQQPVSPPLSTFSASGASFCSFRPYLVFISSEKPSLHLTWSTLLMPWPLNTSSGTLHGLLQHYFSCHTCSTISLLDCKRQEGKTVLFYVGLL